MYVLVWSHPYIVKQQEERGRESQIDVGHLATLKQMNSSLSLQIPTVNTHTRTQSNRFTRWTRPTHTLTQQVLITADKLCQLALQAPAGTESTHTHTDWLGGHIKTKTKTKTKMAPSMAMMMMCSRMRSTWKNLPLRLLQNSWFTSAYGSRIVDRAYIIFTHWPVWQYYSFS